jgi:hypothetical protein
MGKYITYGVLLSIGCTTAACGQKAEEAVPAVSESSGSERAPEDHGGLSISGLRGTLSQDEIQGALEPRMPKLSRCMQKRLGAVEWLSGEVKFQFRVAVDGSVATVYPSQSNMGDRETERCLLEVAKATRFPQPHGGEAEFSWPLEVPPDPEVRPPVPWTLENAGDLADQVAELKAQCPGGPYSVSAYIDTEGKVVAAGGAARDEASAAQLDCISSAVSAWSFESPGSYAAKLTFDIE